MLLVCDQLKPGKAVLRWPVTQPSWADGRVDGVALTAAAVTTAADGLTDVAARLTPRRGSRRETAATAQAAGVLTGAAGSLPESAAGRATDAICADANCDEAADTVDDGLTAAAAAERGVRIVLLLAVRLSRVGPADAPAPARSEAVDPPSSAPSAEATPVPSAIAAPMPSMTARPPIRPM